MKKSFDNLVGIRGFTLIEMLVVISILLLLIAVAMPAFTGVVLTVHVGQSQAIINQLDSAVKAYQADFASAPNGPGGSSDGLPPSNYDDGTNTWYGCQSIVLYLTGYHTDANNNTAYGWRPNRNSPMYGPYNDTEKLKILPGNANNTLRITSTTLTGVTVYGVTNPTYQVVSGDDGYIKDSGGHISHPVFLDAFGSVIIYYSTNRIGDNTHTYNMNDNYCNDGIHNKDIWGNSTSPAGTYCTRGDWASTYASHSGGHNDPSMMTTNANVGSSLWAMFSPPPDTSTNHYYKNASGIYYRSDFMLLSWGGSRNWYSGSPQIKDNATNLYGK